MLGEGKGREYYSKTPKKGLDFINHSYIFTFIFIRSVQYARHSDIGNMILKDTYGIIIYQEQVLEILRSIGGYTYSEADIIRRAMSKKKYDVIEKLIPVLCNDFLIIFYDCFYHF